MRIGDKWLVQLSILRPFVTAPQAERCTRRKPRETTPQLRKSQNSRSTNNGTSCPSSRWAARNSLQLLSYNRAEQTRLRSATNVTGHCGAHTDAASARLLPEGNMRSKGRSRKALEKHPRKPDKKFRLFRDFSCEPLKLRAGAVPLLQCIQWFNASTQSRS